MKMRLYADIINREIHAGDIVIYSIYDPNGLIDEYNNQGDLIIELHLRVSKNGNFVAILKDIKIA